MGDGRVGLSSSLSWYQVCLLNVQLSKRVGNTGAYLRGGKRGVGLSKAIPNLSFSHSSLDERGKCVTAVRYHHYFDDIYVKYLVTMPLPRGGEGGRGGGGLRQLAHRLTNWYKSIRRSSTP